MRERSSKEDTSFQQITAPGWSVVWLVLLVVLALLVLWLALSLHHIQASFPGLSTETPLAEDKTVGVNADLTRYSAADLDQMLTQMSDLGLRWIRQPFPWADIEPAPGQFDWTPWDRVVEATSAHGLQLIAVLDTTPTWSRPADTNQFTPPTELAYFGNFARALSERYQDRIDYYQVWDEPNLSTHWGERFIDPRAYARLLREGAVNIRASDSEAVILTAALAPTVEEGPLNLNELEFLTGLYAVNAEPWFDVVAAQPYGFADEPTAPPSETSLNFNRLELIRQTMTLHGDGHKPIWVTAFGWSAQTQSWSGESSPWPLLSPEKQATYTVEAVHQARANWPWLGPMLFAAWDADILEPDDPRRGLALVSGESYLPQAQAMHELSNSLSLAEDIATVGTYSAHHSSGHYSGNWRFSPAGADVPRLAPATLTIPFDGTRLDLMVRRGAYQGFLYVTIDDKPANMLPQQEGHAYLVLYDPLEQEDTVTLARYLPDGPHTATIEAKGGWYQWPVRGWRVSREGDVRIVRLGLFSIAGFGIVAIVGLACSARHMLRHKIHGLLGWIDELNAHYLALGTPFHLAVLGGTVLVFYFVPGTLLSLLMLVLLFLSVLPRPDLGLALVAFSLPFFLLPKPLIGRTISVTEVSLVLVALAHVARRTATLLYPLPSTPPSNHTPARVSWLDRAAWLLTGTAILASLMTVIPAANTGPLAAADWPILALMLLPLAGVLAAIAQAYDTQCDLTYLRTCSLDLWVMALVGLGLIATLAAQNFGVSFQEFHVVVWDGAAFYAFLRLTHAQNTENRPASKTDVEGVAWATVDAFLLGSSLMALYAIYQFFLTDQAITAEGVHRALGVYGSPNNLALLLDRAAPVLIAVVTLPRHSRIGNRAEIRGGMRVRQLLYGLGLIPTLVALVITFSRGALLLGLPAAILFIGIVRSGRVLWAALGAIAVGATGMLPLMGTDRFRSLLDTSAGTGFFRLRLWQSAWAMLRDHPWLGVGLDNFLYQYRTRYILPDAWQEPNLSHPHNIILDFGTRLGIGGIVLLLWLQFAFWRAAWHLYRRQTEVEKQALALGLMGTMVAVLAHGMVDNSFFLVDLGFILFFSAGIIARLAKSRE